MTTGTGKDAPTRNEEMAALHTSLAALAAKLDLAIDDARDAAMVRQLTARFAAVNARVTAVGRQLFTARTAELSVAAQDVAAALTQVERALGDIERLESALAGVTGVLGLVDKAISIAKSAA